MSRNYHRPWWPAIVIVLAILVIGISAYFQIQGAIQCAADGGEYLRNWNNWPVCVGGSK